MKSKTLFLSGILVFAIGLAGWATMDRYSFASGSRVWVEGTSTVHDWSCSATQVNGSLDASASSTALTAISGLTVTIPVSALDCENGTMNGKLRNALGTSPIRFVASSIRVGSPAGDLFALVVNGQLTIKGTSRAVQFNAQGRVLGNGRYRVTGSVPVIMSQYGVEPPTALLGTLHTGDRTTVRFDVTLAR